MRNICESLAINAHSYYLAGLRIGFGLAWPKPLLSVERQALLWHVVFAITASSGRARSQIMAASPQRAALRAGPSRITASLTDIALLLNRVMTTYVAVIATMSPPDSDIARRALA